ncbi:MAG: peptidoglycan bridge formation glycyltransferase FemA/FemB family protein, partial [Bacilli bacterium]|nr:peptidoglycan bridge formation glycyltransferase FemA/FemB family protein [Bacilli bacterium]
MTFGKLNEQEFKNFIIKHPKRTFFQTIEWGRLKAHHGWQMELLGIKKENQVIGAAMLLSKQTALRKKIYYIPR